MVAQMVLTPERFVANITFVWSLIGVSSLMNEEVVGLGELAPTEATNEFCVDTNCLVLGDFGLVSRLPLKLIYSSHDKLGLSVRLSIMRIQTHLSLV